jgi:serine/threonine protein kinase
MDGAGNFYAAMELMSVERKMRNADGSVGSGVSRAVMRGLRERYVQDLLDEVQKAETLNPERAGTVAKVLRTADGKYVRLEEDYPEEAFFVIAGCEPAEVAGVVALVFCGALRAISRFHAAGWMHGDIKLENLMFDERGELVVIDYENANPFRGAPGAGRDGRVALVSYDWIPPEAIPGPQGRLAGPGADLWALGANLVRAFALRDGIDDLQVREALLGKGQASFLAFRRRQLLRRRSMASPSGAAPRTDSSAAPSPSPRRPPPPRASDIDLSAIFEAADAELERDAPEWPVGSSGNGAAAPHESPAAGPSPARLLEAFARQAPSLCAYVLARCLSELPEERGADAEAEGLALVRDFERERDELGEHSALAQGERAVHVAIELSGSAWVRPKLEAARLSLGLGFADADVRTPLQEHAPPVP